MFSGVRSSTMIWRLRESPTPPSRRLMPRKESSAVETERFMRAYSRLPKVRLVITEAPTPPPMAMEMNTLVRE